MLIFEALFTETNFSFDNFSTIFQGEVLKSIANSLIISLSTGLLSVIIGTGLAFILTKIKLPFKNILRLLLLLPLFLPPYITSVAWTDFWFFAGFPKSFIYSIPSVIFILTTVYIPLSAFIISGSLENVSASIEEAGEMMSNCKTVFLKIILPLIRPALFSSFILIFILSVSEFAVPSYLSVNVFTTEIFTQFTAFYNYSSAIAHALVLTLICFIIIFPGKHYLLQTPFVSFGKKSHKIKYFSVKKPLIYFWVYLTYILLFVLLPVIMLIIQSTEGNSFALIQSIKQLSPAFSNTFLLTISSAVFITILGLIFALLRNKILDYILLFTFAVPAVVTGIALIKFYNTPALNFIYGTSAVIIFAFISRFIFISEKIIATGLEQIPPSYLEAASVMGASPFYSFKKILLPLTAEALFTAFFTAIIFSIGELSAVIMVYPPGISLLSIRIFTLSANAPQNMVSAMCLTALLFTLIIIFIMLTIKNTVFKRQWKQS